MNAGARFKKSMIDRRLLIQGLGLSAAAILAESALRSPLVALAAEAAKTGVRVFPVVTINHLSLAAADYAKSRDWYVDLLGMRVVWDNGKMCALEFGSLTEPNGIYIRGLNQNEKPRRSLRVRNRELRRTETGHEGGNGTQRLEEHSARRVGGLERHRSGRISAQYMGSHQGRVHVSRRSGA